MPGVCRSAGNGGVFGSLPSQRQASVRLVSWDSLAHIPASRNTRRLMRTEWHAA